MTMTTSPAKPEPSSKHRKADRSNAPGGGGGAKVNLAVALSTDVLTRWLRDMVLIREFEVRTMQAYQNRQIGGFCHVYIGQEAVAVGCTAAVNPDDPIITAYRDHGHALARGMAPRYCMAEMFGKIGGCAKGKGGSMHMFDKEHHLFGGHGIVGAQIPLGAGLAFATKYIDEVITQKKNSKVTLCFFGDGAINQGAFHEALNLAGLFNLPVVFICENNGYSMGTAIDRGTTMAHDLSVKARAYGMDSAVVDGMDVLNVYDGMKPVCDRARETSRPCFVDMRTYRFKGHSMSDPRKYRTKEEEAQYESQDPIDRLAKWLQDERDFTEDDYKQLLKDVRREVRDCVKWSEQSPLPVAAEELYKDVYVDEWGPYRGTSLPLMLTDAGRRELATDGGATDDDEEGGEE
jgi:pyruvate dehydrogenase E1 component alpha subunit